MDKLICRTCSKVFSLSWDCKRHIEAVHENKVFPCPKCKKQYKRKKKQKKHAKKCTYIADCASSQKTRIKVGKIKKIEGNSAFGRTLPRVEKFHKVKYVAKRKRL